MVHVILYLFLKLFRYFVQRYFSLYYLNETYCNVISVKPVSYNCDGVVLGEGVVMDRHEPALGPDFREVRVWDQHLQENQHAQRVKRHQHLLLYKTVCN